MIDEATKSEAKAISAALGSTERFLTRRLRLMELEDEESFTHSGWLMYVRQAVTTLRKCRYFCTSTLVQLLQRYNLELQYLAIYLLEKRCLQANGASLAESLYGGKRVKLGNRLPRSGSTDGHVAVTLIDLSPRDKTRAAILLAGLPYIHHRLHRFGVQNAAWKSSTFWKIYQPLRAVLVTLNLICRWRFLIGKSFHFDLSATLLQQVVRRITQADSPNHDSLEIENGTANDRKRDASPTDSSSLTSETKRPQLVQAVLLCISASLAFSWLTQIRHEWNNYRRDELLRRQQQMEQEQPGSNDRQLSLTIPPPPPPPVPLAKSRIPTDRCPLCRKHHNQPTASSSGFVFCLSCVLPYIRTHRKCPVSGSPCDEGQLVRLFEPRKGKGSLS